MSNEKLKFYGRREELLFLLESWRTAKVCNPQWVAYNAETGVGKTRLIQEFYQLLSDFEYQEKFLKAESNNQLKSEDYDPNNYWPNSLPIDLEKLGLNPRSENFETGLNSSELNIPWLWWGIRGIDPGLRNGKEGSSAVSDGLEHFYPHIEPLIYKKTREDSNLAATTEVVKKIANLATGGWLDTFISLGELAAAGKGPLSRLFNKPEIKTIFDNKNRQANQLSDLLQDSIFKFLTEQVPVILILDDVQWLDKDTIDFIDKLIHKLSNKPMKLIIVSTGWAKEWKEESPIKIVFKKFKGKRIERTLSGTPPEHAKAFLLAHFQGLSDEDLALLTKRADGNWRYLTELVMELKSDKTYFEGEDCLAHLSESGRKRIDSEKMEMDDLIKKRFLKFEPITRRALERSSYQGVKFDLMLTSEVTGHMDSSISDPYAIVTEAINKAENPGSMVSSSDGMLKEFLQGPYWRVVYKRLEGSDEFDAVEKAYKNILDTLDGDEGLSATDETIISRFYSLESDSQKKMKMLGLLIHNLTLKKRYQSGCQYINDLNGLVLNEQGEDSPKNLNYFSLKATCSSLQLISYFGFSPNVYDSHIDIESLGIELAGKLQGKIFELESDEQAMKEKSVLADMVGWCEVLVQYRTAFGHMDDIVNWLRTLIKFQELYLKMDEYPSQLRLQIISNRTRYCEMAMVKARSRAEWDLIFDQYRMILSDLEQLEDRTERNILWSLAQISILFYGQCGREYYDDDTDWGDDYGIFYSVAEKLGNILHDVKTSPTVINEYSDEALLGLLLAGSRVIDYSLYQRFPLATEFVDGLAFVQEELFSNSENGANLSQELIAACVDSLVASGDFLRIVAGEKFSNKVVAEVDATPFKIINLASRAVTEDEATVAQERCVGIVKRYMDYGVFTMPIIKSYTQAIQLSVYLKLQGADDILSAFNQLLEYASLCRDGYRAAAGEQVQLLPSLIDIFDRGLKNTPHKEECWKNLRECYGDCEDYRFDALLSKVRSA